jgi:hypothetical protein
MALCASCPAGPINAKFETSEILPRATGKHSVGVQRHCTGSARNVSNCQIRVGSSVATNHERDMCLTTSS